VGCGAGGGGAERSGAGRGGAERSGMEWSGVERSEVERSGVAASGAERSGAERSGVAASGAEWSGAGRSGAGRNETKWQSTNQNQIGYGLYFGSANTTSEYKMVSLEHPTDPVLYPNAAFSRILDGREISIWFEVFWSTKTCRENIFG
jgi:hypothetical protein